ncbi:endoglucanase 24-like protein [Tanacetum coccineum]
MVQPSSWILRAWSVVEFGEMMPPEELRNTLVALRWSTDYLLKTVAQPDRIIVQVGHPINDHNCWERPEDMDTARTIYTVVAPNPASDVAGETAAAFAASSMAFQSSDPGYSDTLLRTASRVFEFADTYRGAYSDNTNIRDGVCPFYCDFDGYQDELLWSGLVKKASKGDKLPELYTKHWYNSLMVNERSKEVLEGTLYTLESYKASAESFMCTLIPDSSSSHIEYTPGGLIFRPGGSNLQHSTTITFLLLVYAKYLERSSGSVNCGSISVGPTYLRQMAKRQVDYILGENPNGMSYMVGYSNKYPQRIHHRGSSLPSIKDHPQPMGCKEGSVYFNSSNPNPNVLVGAIVGGPGEDDQYEDDRADFRKSEPTTYINAPFVGVLAFFAANPNPS